MAQLQTGSSAPDFTLLNADDQTVTLSQLWQEQPVLLTFLRHFG